MNSSIRTCTRYNCICDPPFSATGVCKTYAPSEDYTSVPLGRTCTRYGCYCDPPFSVTGFCKVYSWLPIELVKPERNETIATARQVLDNAEDKLTNIIKMLSQAQQDVENARLTLAAIMITSSIPVVESVNRLECVSSSK